LLSPRGRKPPPMRKAPGRTKSSSSNDGESRTSRTSSSRVPAKKPPLRSASGPVADMGRSLASLDSSSVVSKNSRVSRTKSFDDAGTRPRSSSEKRSRAAARNSKALVDGDEQSTTSRRTNKDSSRDDASHASSRRPKASSSSSTRRRDNSSGSVSRSPSPDTIDRSPVRARGSASSATVKSVTSRSTPISVKRVAKERKPRDATTNPVRATSFQLQF
jgi:hypothetical protein